MNGEKTEERANATRDGGKKLLAAACVLLLLVLGILAFLLLRAPKAGPSGLAREAAALAGQLEGKTEEEIQAELNRIVEEGMFNISINTAPTFENGKAEGPLQIENVPGNRYLMQVLITLDDTGELIYETGLIEPNHHIQSAKLDVELEKGEYLATAVFNAYDPETEEYIGSAGAKLTITVLS
ncbi:MULTISPECIES: hypothetical protein [Anaerotruncus]|uniref:hypothetical protein n=1 Tax=Anaerotruncus TaxID=244127 RepID=UPI000C767478|nr:hypothetical protein [Anaerotruncus massiliensis (ex Togo et al. 2019)]